MSNQVLQISLQDSVRAKSPSVGRGSFEFRRPVTAESSADLIPAVTFVGTLLQRRRLCFVAMSHTFLVHAVKTM